MLDIIEIVSLFIGKGKKYIGVFKRIIPKSVGSFSYFE